MPEQDRHPLVQMLVDAVMIVVLWASLFGLLKMFWEALVDVTGLFTGRYNHVLRDPEVQQQLRQRLTRAKPWAIWGLRAILLEMGFGETGGQQVAPMVLHGIAIALTFPKLWQWMDARLGYTGPRLRWALVGVLAIAGWTQLPHHSRVADKSPAAAQFQEGEDYALVRARLLTAGWQPTSTEDADECMEDDARCQGRPEMLTCSGSGLAMCRFGWERDGRHLTICTAGEEQASFHSICE